MLGPTLALASPRAFVRQDAPAQPQGSSPALRQALGANSLYNGDPNVVADAAQGRGVGNAEANHRRGLESAEAAADIADPNRGQKAEMEGEALDAQQMEAHANAGIQAALSTMKFDRASRILDSEAEYWRQSDDTAENRAAAVYDIKSTLSQPEIQTQIAEEIGVPFERWKKEEWQQAAEIVKLARRKDQNDLLPFMDKNTFGQVDGKAIRDYSRGLRLNTVAK